MSTPKGTKPWNAGTAKGWINQSGYRAIKIGTKTFMVHRLVMEKHIGRSLQPWEAIHHKDGDKANNDVSNLEIIGFAEHAATHHKGTRRSTDTKRSIQLFGQMTKALKDERQLSSELLEALKIANGAIRGINDDGTHRPSPTITFTDDERETIAAAIAKAEGK